MKCEVAPCTVLHINAYRWELMLLILGGTSFLTRLPHFRLVICNYLAVSLLVMDQKTGACGSFFAALFNFRLQCSIEKHEQQSHCV